MRVDDEDFLERTHRSLDQMPVAPDDPRHVPLQNYQEATGPDVVTTLSKSIRWMNQGSVFYVTGTRGAGKSTQLLRLKAALEEHGLAVVRLDADDYLNLRQPLDVVEFIYSMVGAISDSVASEGLLARDTALQKGWQRLAQWFTGLPARVEVEPELGLGTGVDVAKVLTVEANVKARLRQDESFVAAMKRYLAGRVSELSREANVVVAGLVEAVRDKWVLDEDRAAWKGLVVLVDGLDHVRGTDFAEVRRALMHLFETQSDAIALDSVRTVFVLPPWTIGGRNDALARVVNVKVADRSGNVVAQGQQALREVVRLRVAEGDITRLFESGQLDELVRLSGGHLRDLLRLVRNACVNADSLPISEEAIALAVDQTRDALLPLAADERACLRYVRDFHDLPLNTQAEWEALASLFDRHLVLGFRNGKVWYGVHPLVLDSIDEHQAH